MAIPELTTLMVRNLPLFTKLNVSMINLCPFVFAQTARVPYLLTFILFTLISCPFIPHLNTIINHFLTVVPTGF